MKKKHKKGKGSQLAKYDQFKGKWLIDRSQPVGSKFGFAIDSKGYPAIISYTRPPHIFQKEAKGWRHIKACSQRIAFGRYDALYRIGCDGYVYIRNYKKW